MAIHSGAISASVRSQSDIEVHPATGTSKSMRADLPCLWVVKCER